MSSIVELLTNGALVFWGAIAIICVAPIIASYWYKLKRAEIDATLKHEMIQRGMSADEIERVLAAKSRRKDEPPR